MKDILARATRLAGHGRKKLDTGHLLLALSSGKELAASLLKDRGAATARIKNQLGLVAVEPPGAVDTVLTRAQQIALQCQSPRLSSLHVLASLAVRDSGRAASALEALGVDVAELQSQALRRITGLDRGSQGRSSHGEREQLLLEPMAAARPLLQQGARAASAPSTGRANRPSQPPAPICAGRLLDMGRSLENVQRRTRAMRTPSSTEVEPAAKIALETPRAQPLLCPAISTLCLPEKQAPLLSRHGRNLTKLAAQAQLAPVVARPEELERVIDILNKRRHNCPCLVGPVGVGKTALLHALAFALARGEQAPAAGNILVELGPNELLAASSRGNTAQRTAGLQSELAQLRGRAVLVLDDLHAFFSLPEVAEPFAELRGAISRGELTCIAAMTERDFRRFVEPDVSFCRALVPLDIEEPSEETSLDIVSLAAPGYAAHHSVPFTSESLRTAVRLSSRYVADGAMPEKALSTLDLAAGRARRLGRDLVAPLDVAEVLSHKLGIPADRLAASDAQRLLHIEDLLGERVVGHEEALAVIGETLRRNAAGFRGKRPIGSFLLLGPTGVGKTETAKALSELLFPGPGAFVRLDMSEFGEAHTVARLVGAPPGYVGHEDGGQLTEAVRKRPYCLVLLDEIEKAHRDVLQLLLQVLDDGRLTDGKGRTVRFDSTVIMMTSNLGHHATAHKRSVGFGIRSRQTERAVAAQSVLEAARGLLPVELWNRIDEPLVFGALGREDVLRIAALLVRHTGQQLFAEHGIVLRVDDSALEALVAAGGFDESLGARPMRRSVQRLVEAPLARLVLEGGAQRGDAVTLSGEGPQVLLSCEAGEPVERAS